MTGKCVLASGNQGKLAELSGALAGHGIKLVSQSEYNVTEADENASTFVENSLIKARHASTSTGLCALADDSGLVVPALNGEPGIRSARYATTPGGNTKPTDQDNIDKLLTALAPLPSEARAAYFVCALVFLRHAQDPEPLIATGLWQKQKRALSVIVLLHLRNLNSSSRKARFSTVKPDRETLH